MGNELNFLTGGGEMGNRIRTFDWPKSALGPIEAWPQSLKTSISLMLTSQHPIWIGWGPEAAFLYNDAYIQVLSSAKHPKALGAPASEVWAEIWDYCGPLADKVFQKGEASFVDDVRLFMSRGDFLEETFYSFSYSPIRDESGNVGGLFCPSAEVTSRALNTRRLRTLSELAAKSLLEKSPTAACASAAATFKKNRDDVPFALLYLIDAGGKSAFLEQAVSLPKNDSMLTPEMIELAGREKNDSLWPLAAIFKSSQPQVVSLQNVKGVPLGAADRPLTEAIVLPLISRDQERPLGILIAGVNPTRKLDSDYRTFFELAAGHISTAIHNARAAEEEKHRAEMLAELDRAKTTFFSNVSHELRTPLTLILGPLEEELRASAVPNERLELVHRNGLRLLKLVNTLLDFSRIEAGRVEPAFAPTDLAAYTRELASVFRSVIDRAGLKFIVNCPPLTGPFYVDRDMWEKIVFNLLSNALKFTFEGEIEIKLSETNDETAGIASGASLGKSVRLSVRDTGTGISEAELPRVFERFHRVRNARSRSHEGTGIGLALVQELTRLHGGAVQVASVEGKGTTFIVSIPAGTAHLPREQINLAPDRLTTGLLAQPFVEESLRWLPEAQTSSPSARTETAHFPPAASEASPARLGVIDDGVGKAAFGSNQLSHTPPPNGSKPRILLADDNSDMREYVRRLLVAQGYEVIAAENGRIALDIARTQTPSLVLSDVMMPQLDGFGLLRELRNAPATRAIPIILLSARAGEEARVEGAEAGADDYLTKPFSARELLARVRTHLDLARIRREAEDAIRLRGEEAVAATAKFRAVFDQSATFAGIMSLDGKIMEANRLWLEICGFPAENVVGKFFWETPWWRNSSEIQQKIRDGTAWALQGKPYLEILPYHWADGSEHLVDFALYPIRDDAGRVIFLHPTGLDITERQQAQKRTEFLSQLTQKVSTVSDPEEINRVATREIGQFMGAQRCYFFQALPGPQSRVLPDWNRGDVASLEGTYDLNQFGKPQMWMAAQVGPVSFDDVNQHIWTKDLAANYRAIKIQSFTMAPFIHQGQWVASIGISSDKPRHWTTAEIGLLENAVARVWPLIEKAQVQLELRKSENALREANSLLADKAAHLESIVQQRTVKLRETIGELEAFSYSIAHDMRAPLRSLQGFSNILIIDYSSKLDEECQRFLKLIAAAAGRMDRLIQDVLSYSQVVRGEFPLEKVDLSELLRGIIDTYPQFAVEAADINLSGPFPVVLGNPAMLMQIFSNLMGNAVKFISPGIKPKVKIWADSKDKIARVFVQDNGIGIAADQHEKIFALFQRVEKNFEGTGIGLAIVKKTVERMGGRVGLHSELGQGSTFWIEIQTA